MIRGKKPEPTLVSAYKEIKKRRRNLGKGGKNRRETEEEFYVAEDCHTEGYADKGCMQKWIITRA